jgi:hypothetical protein
VITLGSALKIFLVSSVEPQKKKKPPEGGSYQHYLFELHAAISAIKIIVTGTLLSNWFAFRKKLAEHIQ